MCGCPISFHLSKVGGWVDLFPRCSTAFTWRCFHSKLTPSWDPRCRHCISACTFGLQIKHMDGMLASLDSFL